MFAKTVIFCYYKKVWERYFQAVNTEVRSMTRLDEATVTEPAPLRWTPASPYQGKLFAYATKHLGSSTSVSDTDEVASIMHTLCTRIVSNLGNANLHAYDPEISYQTILNDILKERNLVEGLGEHDEEINLIKDNLTIVWRLASTTFEQEFTKPNPDTTNN